MTDVEMVATLEIVRRRCVVLLGLLDQHDQACGRAMAAADSLALAVDVEVANLRGQLALLTTAATVARTSLQAAADDAVGCLHRVGEDATATGTAVAGLVTAVEEGCTKAQTAADQQAQAIRKIVEAIDTEIVDLGAVLTELSGTLVEGRTECVMALNEAYRWLEEACVGADRGQLEWRAGLDDLLVQTHKMSLYVSRLMSEAADAHARALLATFNDTIDDHNDVIAALQRLLVEDVDADLHAPRTALGEVMDELAMHAEERERQIDDAQAAIGDRMRTGASDLDALRAAVGTTAQIGR